MAFARRMHSYSHAVPRQSAEIHMRLQGDAMVVCYLHDVRSILQLRSLKKVRGSAAGAGIAGLQDSTSMNATESLIPGLLSPVQMACRLRFLAIVVLRQLWRHFRGDSAHCWRCAAGYTSHHEAQPPLIVISLEGCALWMQWLVVPPFLSHAQRLRTQRRLHRLSC